MSEPNPPEPKPQESKPKAKATAPSVGELVTTDDGGYAIVAGVDKDGTHLLPLGTPVRHELPVTKAA